jgi:hypothetical protein
MATVSKRTQLLDTENRNPPHETEDGIPPLEAGDRLSRAEFERRYEAMPNLKKAELIEGVVYVRTLPRLDRSILALGPSSRNPC